MVPDRVTVSPGIFFSISATVMSFWSRKAPALYEVVSPLCSIALDVTVEALMLSFFSFSLMVILPPCRAWVLAGA